MKNFIVIVFIVCFSAGMVSAAEKTAYIDLQEVFSRFYKTELAQDQVRQQIDDIKMERMNIEADVKVLKEDVEVLRADSRDDTLSDEIRQSKRDQLEEKLVDIHKKERDMAEYEKLRKEQMEQQNTRMTKKILDEIHEVVINFAKANGYSSVVDRSAKSTAGMSVVLYVSPKIDITAEVLKELNEGQETGRSGSDDEKEEQE